jgi:hypothetical protein
VNFVISSNDPVIDNGVGKLMFERKIEETIAFLKRETIGDLQHLTARQITASILPSGLRSFFERDIDIWAEEERNRLLEATHFEYTDDVILAKFNEIAGMLPEHARFSANEFEHALDRNTKLLFNYVCRPQWSLQRYFFSERDHVPTDEIIRSLRYFWYYEYFRLILTEYFSKKKMTVIDSKKFEELLSNVDQEIVRNFDSRKLAALSEPIFDIFNIGNESDTRVVPLEAMSIFYDDKNLSSVVEHLDRQKSSREFVTMHDLVLLISEVDYTMSLDISSIVNQHARSLGVMPPERNSNAGKDFPVPHIPAVEQEPIDIGDEERHLDFVITDAENGVIERDFDSMHDADENDEQDDSLPVDDEETMTEDDNEMTDTGPEYLLEDDVNSFDEEEQELPPLSFTEEGILDLEEDLHQMYDSEDASGIEDPDAEEDIGDTLDQADDVMEEMGTLEDMENHPNAGAVDDEIDIDMSIEDEEDSVDPSQATHHVTELEIDWEKEAANIPDIAIDELDDDSDEATLPSDIQLTADNDLKPAEELLSQLNLDDLDDGPESGSSALSASDIPLAESPEFERRERSMEIEEEEKEEDVPAEEVIQQYGDLLQAISASDQKKYAKKLFKRNDDTVMRALTVLNGKPTWREASEYIDDLFIKHDVDMYSRIAVQFTDDIYKRYLPRK